MKIFSGYVREQKRYTKNELKHIFSFDEAGVEKFIKSLKAYGVLKSVKNSNAQLEMSDLVDEDIEITDETAVSVHLCRCHHIWQQGNQSISEIPFIPKGSSC